MDDGLAPDVNGNAEGELTMTEYIEREAALMKLMQDGRSAKNLQSISDMPAADVAPVRHGRWEEASDGDGIVCPFCRTDFCTIIYDTEYFNYCPNCGAKMDESEDKNEIF